MAPRRRAMVLRWDTLPPGQRLLPSDAPEPRSVPGSQPPGLARAPPGRDPSPPPTGGLGPA
eukprot:12951157-Alexandrium_andersonii.AAC.1